MGDNYLHYLRLVPDYLNRVRADKTCILRRATQQRHFDVVCFVLTFFTAEEFWEETGMFVSSAQAKCAPLIRDWTDEIAPKRARFMATVAPELIRRTRQN